MKKRKHKCNCELEYISKVPEGTKYRCKKCKSLFVAIEIKNIVKWFQDTFHVDLSIRGRK